MEKFLALSKEKQKRIIEAGFNCFGKMGYKKASAQDIAQLAGISKGMIFHYFGSKKGMYLYLIEISYTEIMESFKNGYDITATDFFDRILMLTNCKIDCIKKHPSLLSFFTSLYFETDAEVFNEIQKILEQGKQIRADSFLKGSDKTKFKDPMYAEMAGKLLMGYGEGCVNAAATMDIDGLADLQEEFTSCVFMLKKNLYKEEYI